MKHITITVKSELEDIELYLRDILTTMKHHDEVTDFSVKTSTFTERPEKEHSNNKSISNHEAAEILKLMPKQSEAIKKAIEVLESENYYKSLAESYGETINKLITAISESNKWIPVGERLPENFQRVLVTLVNYNGDKVVRVAEYIGKQRIFQIKENRDIWEVGEKGLLAWRPLPEPYKAESEG